MIQAGGVDGRGTFGHTRQTSALVLAGALVAGGSACAAKRMTVPSGPRSAAPDAVAVWTDAAETCRAVRVYSSTVRVGGRVGGERIPAGLSIASGFERSGRLRLEGSFLGRLVFTLAGTPDRATLVLHREREFVIGRPDRILGALFGAEVAPVDLLAILTGCVSFDGAVTGASRVGDLVEITIGPARVYLQRVQGRLRPRLAFTAGLQADFTAFDARWPTEIRLWTEAGAAVPAELRLRIDAVATNDFTLPEAAFTVEVPAGATEVDVEALRRAVSRKGPDG